MLSAARANALSPCAEADNAISTQTKSPSHLMRRFISTFPKPVHPAPLRRKGFETARSPFPARKTRLEAEIALTGPLPSQQEPC